MITKVALPVMLKRFFLNEKNMMIAILLNAIIIFILYFPKHTHNDLLVNLDHFFVLLFVLEAIVKIGIMKQDYFKDNWNRFDFFIVLVSLPSLIPGFAGGSVLKVLRLLRLIRLVKALWFIPRMSMILAGLGRAMKASIFVMLALFFLNFMLALFTCHFFGEDFPDLFGDPLISSYYIFQLFTIEGWNEIPAVIAEKYEGTYWAGFVRFYFVLVVLAGGIFGMSLANAIFVDEMTMDNNQDVEAKIDGLKEQIQELKELLKDQQNSKS